MGGMRAKRSGKCNATGKIRYSEIEAMIALASIQSNAKDSIRDKNECRIYECRACKGWHLTSQEVWERIHENPR